ncbi:MAG: serine/threonine protein phosphatase [Alphaproteobacteria bacterium]|nr:serine/threonine protein phosphatase [Alphaproteobacteria bacterium]MCB9797619.1 serine/threonine protein phosphatase [Alphaproteobacteria bacterium]
MRTLIVGDVHGCADELAELVARAQPDRVLLVGDLFTKGPDPVGVWALIQEHRMQAVLGNHDDYVLQAWDREDTPAVRALRARSPEVRGWLAALPLFMLEPGLVVVHAGVHPLHGVGGTSRIRALTMRRFPDDRHVGNPFWYDAGWVGPETVVFGHDARRGLVRRERDGRPVAIGLDSGCVYGRQLTGWLREEDQLFAVGARKVWHEPRGRVQ